jgi:hypothetical protein
MTQFFTLVTGRTNIEKSGSYLIVFLNATREELETIFSTLWKTNVVNLGVVTEKDDLIQLMTFFPFGSDKCGDTTPIVLNGYNKQTMKWESSNFFPKKLKSLNNCVVNFGSFLVIPTVMKKENGQIYGSEADMIFNMGKIMNFTVKYKLFEMDSGVIHEKNGTGTGLMKRALNKEVDAINGFLSLQHSRAKFLTASKAFAQVPMAIIIPPGSLVTPFDKLFYPFSKDVWFMLIAMYAIVFFIIAMLEIFSKVAYNFLIGQNIQNPYLSMLVICLGFTQPKLPNRNFSRFTLMNFMLFWLVVRTCYQGILFNLLKKELLEKEVTSIDEMLEKDYKFYLYTSLEKRVEGTSFYPKRVMIKLEDLEKIRDKTLNPDFNGAVFNYQTQALYLNKINRNNFTYRICKERVIFNGFLFDRV